MDLQPSQADYGAQVVLQVAVPTEETEALAQQLRDGTAGRVGVT
jgi:putative IMPACT (imprinted ancient) family translation regulator